MRINEGIFLRCSGRASLFCIRRARWCVGVGVRVCVYVCVLCTAVLFFLAAITVGLPLLFLVSSLYFTVVDLR